MSYLCNGKRMPRLPLPGHRTAEHGDSKDKDTMRLYFPKEYKALTRLGIPITIGQVGLTMQNLADNVMVGQHSTEELAAAGFINSMFILVLLVSTGFTMGAISQIGALYSQGNKPRIAAVLKSSLLADVVQSLLLCMVLVGLYFALPYMGQPDELVPLMQPYLVIQICSLPLMAAAGAFRQFTDSINDTSVAMFTMLAGNVWNILFNWLLIFGEWGFPEMGIQGAAWATFSSRVLILVLAVGTFLLRPKYREYVRLWREAKVTRSDLLLLNRLGWPIGIQLGMEVASFALVAIFIGWLGTTTLAAHQVMLSMTNLIFMFYLGIATAVSIRVSNYNGLHDLRGVRQAAFAGYEMILCIGVVLSTLAFVVRGEISGLFTDSAEVAAIVSTLIIPLILYQLGDATQVTFSNALRGIGDVKKLMKYSFIAYILISLPASYVMGIAMGWGALGVWMGFPIGLSTAGALYLRRFLWVSDMKRR